MMGIKIIQLIIFLITAVYPQINEKTIKRDRNSGTIYINSANVSGNGNLFISSEIAPSIGKNNTSSVFLNAGIKVGIGEIFQVNINTGLKNFRIPSTSSIIFTATTPGNNNLRFFNLSLGGILFLSTEMDTIDKTTDNTKPIYNPYGGIELTLDFDFIALKKRIPVKTYLRISTYDNPSLLNFYKQFGTTFALEYKEETFSYFVNIGGAVYYGRQYKSLVRNGTLLWIAPGVQRLVRGKFKVYGAAKIYAYKLTNDPSNFLIPTVSFKAGISLPIIYKETNTEAVRTILLNENKKKKEKYVNDNINSRENINIIPDFDITGETFDYNREKEELIQKREEILRKMKEMEKMLNESNKDEN